MLLQVNDQTRKCSVYKHRTTNARNHHHHQFNSLHECSVGNKMHDKMHGMVQKDIIQTKLGLIANESVLKVTINDITNFFLNCNQHFRNFKP